MVCNNNHWYPIDDEKIKNSIVFGDTIDLNKFNKPLNFKFDHRKKYMMY